MSITISSRQILNNKDLLIARTEELRIAFLNGERTSEDELVSDVNIDGVCWKMTATVSMQKGLTVTYDVKGISPPVGMLLLDIDERTSAQLDPNEYDGSVQSLIDAAAKYLGEGYYIDSGMAQVISQLSFGKYTDISEILPSGLIAEFNSGELTVTLVDTNGNVVDDEVADLCTPLDHSIIDPFKIQALIRRFWILGYSKGLYGINDTVRVS